MHIALFVWTLDSVLEVAFLGALVVFLVVWGSISICNKLCEKILGGFRWMKRPRKKE